MSMPHFQHKKVLFSRFLHFTLTSFCLFSFCLSVQAGGREKPGHVPGEVIVKFYGQAPQLTEAPSQKKQRLPRGKALWTYALISEDGRTRGLKLLAERYALIGVEPLIPPSRTISSLSAQEMKGDSNIHRLVFAPEVDLDALIRKLKQIPAVAYAEPNYIGSLAYTPTDPLYPQQSGDLANVAIEDAWDIQQGASASVVVAVIDSGVDSVHSDISAALDLANSYNFVDDNIDVFDDVGHGTRVAGIIGATANNSEGIAGIAFGCTILSLDVADPNGVITSADVASAINYAVNKDAHIINLSLTFKGFSLTLQNSCAAAFNAGVLLIAAAGNENQGDIPVYPASFNSAMGVGALMDDGVTRAPWSNFNRVQRNLVDIVAPGATIFSTIPGSQYNGSYGSGTSFAAPMVTGVAALLKTRNPTQSGAGLRAHLRNTATDLGSSFQPVDGAGSGRLNAKGALETAMTPTISIQSVTVDDNSSYDPDNDADGVLDVDEQAKIIVMLTSADADGSSISGTISTTDPDIGTITNNTSSYGTITVGESKSNSDDAFSTITVSASAGVKDVSFTLDVSGNGSFSDVLSFNLPIEDETPIFGIRSSYAFTSSTTYHVTGNLTLHDATTIPPGTVFKVDPGVDVRLGLNCALTAVGTADNPIEFTSARSLGISRGGGLGPQNEGVNLSSYDEVRYVDAVGGSDTSGDGTSTNPWQSITYALVQIADASSSNRYVLLVAEGTYAGATINMKSYVDIYGGFEASGWSRNIFDHESILSGENTRGVVVGSDNSRLDGFMITRGSASGDGGGISCIAVSPIIANNIIWKNGANGSGGGIYCAVSASPMIKNNIIIDNQTPEQGGGIYCANASPIIIKNIIHSNLNWSGIWCGNSSPIICNNVINSNAPHGIVCQASSPILSNNVINSNHWAGIYSGGSSPSVTNNIIRDNWNTQIFVAGSPTPTVTYCNVEGGYSGTGNLDVDPKFAGPFAWGIATAISYDASTFQSTLTNPNVFLEANVFAGCLIQAGFFYYVVKSNTSNTIIVWGDVTQGGSVSTPLLWEIEDFHLLSTSPCIDVGNPTTSVSDDIDGDTRPIDVPSKGRDGTGDEYDIGLDEYNADTDPAFIWGKLWVTEDASSAQFQHVIVEHGEGMLNEIENTTISYCQLNNNAGKGLECTSGTAAISYTTATVNLDAGIDAPDRSLNSCAAFYNGGKGLVGTALTGCYATGNGDDALTGTNATDCMAEFNAGDGLVLTGTALRASSEANRGTGIVTTGGNVTDCEAKLNTSVGIEISGGGTGSGSTVSFNDGGGIVTDGSTISNCTVEGNAGVGATGSGASSVSNSRIIDNTGAAVSGVTTVQNCAVANNGGGISGVSTVSGSYCANNTGAGITGGTITDATIVGNSGDGINSLTSLDNSWVMNNGGCGVFSTGGTGTVTNSTIRDNTNVGVQDILSLSNCNIYGNGPSEAKDAVTAGSGYRNFENNYWGAAHTAELVSKPEWANLDFINDSNDGSGNYIIDVWPYQSTAVADAPNTSPPAFLRFVEPNLDNAVNVGKTTFTLTFSEAMNTTIEPAVTFGLADPYDEHVVEPDSGWISNATWKGVFWVQSDTGDGLNTIRVSDATDASGFVIPDDTAHRFLIDTLGGGSANNGLASALSETQMHCIWTEENKPPTTLGYNIRRSATGAPGSYHRINGILLTLPEYTDAGLIAGSTYFYIVDIVDSQYNAAQWTPPFFGTTQGTAPTPTPTQTPTGLRDWFRY